MMARTRSSRSKGKSRTQSRARSSAGGARPSSAGGARPSRAGSAQASPPARPEGNGRAAEGGAALRSRPGPSQTAVGSSGPPGWLRLTALILSLGGLGVSVYLTITHYSTAVTLACPESSTINCEKVTTSPESVVFGIPVAVLGLAFFVLMVAVNNPLGWRAPLRLIHQSRVLSVIAGMGFVIYLIYVELFKVNAICLWCTSVHVITFALFVLILLGAAIWGNSDTTQRRAGVT